jgi:peptide/nickel transport system permease protein
MQQYILRRLLLAVPVVLGVATLVFVLMRIVPGDVALLILGDSASDEAIQSLRVELGLDKPVPVQYLAWMGGLLRGDLGTSLLTKDSTLEQLARRWPVTFELTVTALLIAVAVAIPIGVVAAVRQDKAFDHVVRVLAILGLSVPEFWLATMTIVLLALWFQYSPPLGYVNLTENPWANLQQILIPAVILAIHMVGSVARMTRATMLEVMRQDYVRTARAKGLRQRQVLYRHAVKNAMIPVVALIGLSAGRLLGGTVILESIFNLPGVGRLTVDAIWKRDYTQLQANIIFFSLFFVIVNLLIDLTYARLDPRIRFK